MKAMPRDKKNGTAGYAAAQALYWMSAALIYVNSQVFLQDLGFSTARVGFTLALANVCAMLVQPALATLADRGRLSLKALICVLIAGGTVCGALLFLPSPLLVIGCLFSGLTVCTACAQPFLNSAGFAISNAGGRLNFSAARGVGSAFFAAGNIAVGWLMNRFGASLVILLSYYIAANAALFVWTLILLRGQKSPAAPQQTSKAGGNFALLKRHPAFLWLLIGLILVFFTHNLLNTYLWSITESVGGDRQTLGLLIGVAAFTELPAMLFFVKAEKRTGDTALLVLGGVMQTVKAATLLLSFLGLWVVYLSQTMQLLSYALVIPATAYWANRRLAENDRVKGQALLTTTAVISAIFSNLAGGPMIQGLGVAAAVIIGTAVSLVGTVCMLVAAFWGGGVKWRENS